jgi:RNA polymerase sigma-54 factor
MPMKQSIQLRLGQQLTMTPQLQQAIRLLQLSMLDLQHEIQDALDSNLMLEDAEDAERLNGNDGFGDERAEAMNEPAEMATTADPEREVSPESTPMPDELPVDAEWTDHFDSYVPSSGSSAQDPNEIDIFAQQSKAPSLQDHLHWQLNLSRLQATDLAIATAIVDAVNQDGYFTTTPEDLLETLDDDDLTLEEVEAVLHRVQSLDPPGVGARDLRECLLIQLRNMPDGDRIRDLAMRVCD